MPSPAAALTPDPAAVRRGVRGTYAVFIAMGFAYATWASRIPATKAHLHLNPQQLGLVLLTTAVGSLIALPMSGLVVGRLGARRSVAYSAPVLGVALALVGIGYLTGVATVVGGLFLFGLSTAIWDVGMNVHAAAVEQALGRAIMSRFHAGYSVGTVAGAVVGVGAVAARVPVPLHLGVVAALVAVGVPFGAALFLPGTGSHPAEPGGPSARRSALTAWTEPRTVLIGLVVLVFALGEGAGNDWISVALIDDYHAAAVIGTIGLSVFMAAMTVGRWFGPGLLDRFGRVPVLRVQGLIAIAGVALFVLAEVPALGLAGIALWGIGISLGFPTGMSAASDDPRRAAPRVSVVASIGYCAFLAGPPLLGFLGQHFTVLNALLTVAALLALALLAIGSVRPLPGTPAAAPATASPADAPPMP